MNSEVLIYLQRVKDYMSKNHDAREKLMIDKNEEKFYEILTSFSNKNWETVGSPELTENQFFTVSMLANSNNSEIIYDMDLGDEGDSYIFLIDNEYETIKYGKL